MFAGRICKQLGPRMFCKDDWAVGWRGSEIWTERERHTPVVALSNFSEFLIIVLHIPVVLLTQWGLKPVFMTPRL